MTLLEFARGPALQWAAAIFVVGMLWRTVGLLMLMRSHPLSADRRENLAVGGVRAVFHRFSLSHVFQKKVVFQYVAGWAWHLGFFIVLFFFQLHINFFAGILGFSWPALPNGLIVVFGSMSAAVLLMLFVRRFTHPVLRYLSTFNDYSSVLVTALPFITGLAAYMHIGLRYETLLALHFLSIALLLVWMPFSKLFHVVTILPSRYILGVKFWRRGVEA